MIILKKILFIFVLIFIVGCTQARDFSYGVSQLDNIDSKYNTTVETYPNNIPEIDLMINELKELKKLPLEKDQEPFNYLVDYKILNLEVERMIIKGNKYGKSGTTKFGFGCKIRPLITESVSFRNKSSIIGFEAVSLLREFVDKYPEDASSVGLSYKNSLFLNATFYQISKEARRDSRVINNFCPASTVLELYQAEFRKKTNLSEDFINNLSYEEAAPIWKELRGIT